MKRVLQGKEEWPKRDKKTQESVVESIVCLWVTVEGKRKDVIGAEGMGRKRGSTSPGKAEGLRWQGWWRGCLGKKGVSLPYDQEDRMGVERNFFLTPNP